MLKYKVLLLLVLVIKLILPGNKTLNIIQTKEIVQTSRHLSCTWLTPGHLWHYLWPSTTRCDPWDQSQEDALSINIPKVGNYHKAHLLTCKIFPKHLYGSLTFHWLYLEFNSIPTRHFVINFALPEKNINIYIYKYLTISYSLHL